ncbi:kinase-like domain-containing protein [Sparassis latifolia]|uniref:Kinase-like protein n=1 Tax=Sparassis crispa TaxID=139825 RepID=A0A401GSY2_9APHY|nr:kinase-like protein [Sparassis crispa]GBE85342.1 kinase-like protein [Sparassis crispa]
MPIEQDHNRLSAFWLNETSANGRPKLPTILTDVTDDRQRVPAEDGLDHEENMSPELGVPVPCMQTASTPQPEDPFMVSPSPMSSSFSQGDLVQAGLSMSPAAMFLSSFSPSTHATPLPDAEGESVGGYTLGPVIAYGGFSIIRRAYSVQGGTVAVKIVRRSDVFKQADPVGARKRLHHEAAVWASLSHEHILPLFSVTHTQYADFFVTLYCPAGSLFDILKRDGRPALPQDDAGMMFRQVVRGLRYLHEVAGYVHGDMKLENVLVDEMGVCRITDFGMARKIGEIEEQREDDHEHADGEDGDDREHAQRPHNTWLSSVRRSHSKHSAIPVHLSLLRRNGGARHRNSSPFPASSTPTPIMPTPGFQPGSLPYASPELLMPPSPSSPYLPNPAQDIWALGVMLYAVLTGRLPFVDPYDPRLQMKILHGVYEVPKGIGRGAERVLAGCLERSVPLRWTIAMVDEVAWGVGWGEEGDVTPPPECPPSRLSSRSRSQSRPPKLDTAALKESQHASSHRARPASCSTSALRSKSRSTSRNPPRPHDGLRHQHRHPHPAPIQPSFSVLTNSIFRTSSMSSSTSSSSALNDSALLLTPNHSHDVHPERGRLRRSRMQGSEERSMSRSVSPLEALMTPKDVGRDALLRGNKFSETAVGDSPTLNSEANSTDLDALDEPSQWTLGPSVLGEGPLRPQRRVSSTHRHVREDGQRKGVRPGSMPPTPFPWSLSHVHANQISYSSASTPRPTSTRNHPVRSRSVDVAVSDGTALRSPRRL